MLSRRRQGGKAMERRVFLAGCVSWAIFAHPAVAQPIRELSGHHGPVFAVAFRGDGQPLATASLDHTIRLWDVGSAKPLRTLSGHDDKVLTLAWSPDGKCLASAGLDYTIR